MFPLIFALANMVNMLLNERPKKHCRVRGYVGAVIARVPNVASLRPQLDRNAVGRVGHVVEEGVVDSDLRCGCETFVIVSRKFIFATNGYLIILSDLRLISSQERAAEYNACQTKTLYSAKYSYLELRQEAEGGRPPAEQRRRGRVKGEKVDRHKGDRLGASVGRVTGVRWWQLVNKQGSHDEQ